MDPSSPEMEQQLHIVCVPYPAQGHINPMLKLALLLHNKGFHITFIHTEFTYKRLLKSRGHQALQGLPSFQFKTIPDGLPQTDVDSAQHVPSLCESLSKNGFDPLLQLLREVNCGASFFKVPPISCVIADSIMSFGLRAAGEIGVPGVSFRTASSSSLMCYKHIKDLVDQGFTPLKDSSYLKNGYLETTIDWIPGIKDLRLRDFPTFVRTTDRNDTMLNFAMAEIVRSSKASAIIINTFDELEYYVLQALTPLCPPIYTIGPLQLLIDQLPPDALKSIGSTSSLWKEEPECLQWLNSKEASSVIYVNFGSVIMLSLQQLEELARGLANSKKNFLWIIRPGLVADDFTILPKEFLEETKDRGLIANWCPQEQVLNHPSVGGFLTHCGWNSILESLCCGVPMICSPFFADQHINCRFVCRDWGVGTEINEQMKRDEIEYLVRELMDGEKGKDMRRRSAEWKQMAEEATSQNGSSTLNLERLLKEVLLPKS